MSSQWPEVNAERVCPICNHDRRCKVSEDNGAARCFRSSNPPSGWQRSKQHSDGGGTFHRLGVTPPPTTTIRTSFSRSTASKRTALPVEMVDRIYRRLLELCPATNLHKSILVRRGLSKEEIERRQFGTMPLSRDEIVHALREEFSEQALLATPGIAAVEGVIKLGGASGLIVPVRGVDGSIVGLKIRVDRPRDGVPKYSYVSSASRGGCSPGSPCHIPLGISGPARIVRITEGELKADIAYSLSGVPTISFAGAESWKSVLPVLKELATKTVCVAFDADCRTNPQVAAKLLECVTTLKSEGYEVEVEVWNIVDGKGIDDLLAVGKQPENITGDAATTTIEEIAKQAGVDSAKLLSSDDDEIIVRLRDVLASQNKSDVFADTKLIKDLAQNAIPRPALYARAREMASEAGISMTNWDLAFKKALADAAKEQPATLARDNRGGFHIEYGCICRTRQTVEGPKTVQLCNFVANVVSETTRDDGVEKRIVLELEGTLSDELSTGRTLRRIEVNSQKFEKLEWVVSEWGTDAIVYPGESRLLPAAIQLLSQSGSESNKKPKQRRTIYEHTGWREINGAWRYLHAGGTIPASLENSPVSVDLQPPLSAYVLPVPPAGEELIAAIRASLAILSVAPAHVMFPLLAATFRAPLGPCDFAISLVGPSGLGKSELAALAMQHFGAGLDARHLPGSWSSTPNFTERLAFLAKDSLLVVDDFAPAGNTADVQRYRQSAERVFRAQGNNAGRSRMKYDGSLRPQTPPRTLLISTGEDVAGGQSARARQLILEISPGDITLAALTPHQANAADGIFTQTMAGYIAWIAERYEQVQHRKKEHVAELRKKAKSERQHARTPSTIGELAFAFRLFLQFAVSTGAISDAERAQLRDECWDALITAAKDQTVHQTASDGPKEFIKLLSSGLATGRMHVANIDADGPPDDPETWGWRMEFVGREKEWRAKEKRIGWTDGVDVFLDGRAAFTEAMQFAEESGQTLPVSRQTLFKTLRDRKMLSQTEPTRNTTMVRKRIHGRRRSVLAISVELLSDPDEQSDTELETTPIVTASCDAKLGTYPTQAELALNDDAAEAPQKSMTTDHLAFNTGQVTGQLSGHRFAFPKIENHTGKQDENVALVSWSAHMEIEGPCNGYEEYTFM